MVLKADLEIRRPGSTSDIVTDGACVVHMSGDGRHCISIFRARSGDQLRDLIDGHSHLLASAGLIETAESWAVARCNCPVEASVVIPTIKSAGCTLLWPTVHANGRKHYTVVAPSRGRLRALVEQLRDVAEVQVSGVRDVSADDLDVDVPLAGIAQGLTPRQLEVLRIAVRVGYYDTPRRAYAEDVADVMGISRSTLQEHLQKAEATVLRAFVSMVARHPALGRGDPEGVDQAHGSNGI